MVINISPPLLKRREDAGAPVPGSKGGHCQTGHLASFFNLIFIFFSGRKCVFQSANLVVFRERERERERKKHFSVLSLSQLFMKDYRYDWFLFGRKLLFPQAFLYFSLYLSQEVGDVGRDTKEPVQSDGVWERRTLLARRLTQHYSKCSPQNYIQNTHTHTHTHTHVVVEAYESTKTQTWIN